MAPGSKGSRAPLVLRGGRGREVGAVDLQDVHPPEGVPAHQLGAAEGERGALPVVAVEAGDLAPDTQVHYNRATPGAVRRPPRPHVGEGGGQEGFLRNDLEG